jgi:hypothetical protein
MLLKRLYANGPDKAPTGIEVLRSSLRQNFSPNLLAGGAREGWLELGGGKVKILARSGTRTYRILRGPGTYCCHCAKELGSAEDARVHLELEHKGRASPDPNNPAGYRKIHHYECERE